jgi:hypothetical protein
MSDDDALAVRTMLLYRLSFYPKLAPADPDLVAPLERAAKAPEEVRRALGVDQLLIAAHAAGFGRRNWTLAFVSAAQKPWTLAQAAAVEQATPDMTALEEAGTHAAIDRLSKLPAQESLGWKVSSGYFHAARRFAQLTQRDWVLVCFDNAIHLGRVVGEVKSDPAHPLNLKNGELFKFRHVIEKKTFRLSDLPDAYRIVTQVGRSNVHGFGDTYKLVELLALSSDAKAVTAQIAAMPLADWLDMLGPVGWESLCVGYLILNEHYVPTGLMVGRTLSVFDIVGRSWIDGAHIVAQCKKPTTQRVAVEGDFISACGEYGAAVRAYYFAYAGCTGAPQGLRVLDKQSMLDWLTNTADGRCYAGLLASPSHPAE